MKNLGGEFERCEHQIPWQADRIVIYRDFKQILDCFIVLILFDRNTKHIVGSVTREAIPYAYANSNSHAGERLHLMMQSFKFKIPLSSVTMKGFVCGIFTTINA